MSALLQLYRPTTQPDEVGSSFAEVASSHVELDMDSINPVLAVREPEALVSGAATYFTRGSHRGDVLRIQGTPSSINSYPSLGHESWKYGYSRVDISLRDERVTEWNNTGNLKVRMEPESSQ